jgi:phosphatidylserine decarboxylase
MATRPGTVVSPCDSKVVVGSFASSSLLFLKGKFFDFIELLGPKKSVWHSVLAEGSFAVFRLTPEKYHYNHAPVSGRVTDFYEIGGSYHSCNPHAVVDVITPLSKNKRVVTIIDTDVMGGSRVGFLAMIEVVALGIGEIVQCYSREEYRKPEPVHVGMLLEKGAPKSLFRPGSSTVVLIFQKNRVRFSGDILANMYRNARSVYSIGFGKPLVETEVHVRSEIAVRNNSERTSFDPLNVLEGKR